MKLHNQAGEMLEHVWLEGEREDVLVIVGHGLTGSLSCSLVEDVACRLHALGWPVLRLSYAGCGGSEGDFEQATISKESQDLSAVIDQVGCGRKVAYVGYSMGGAVGAMTVGRDDRLQVMVSIAGMVDTAEFFQQHFGGQVPGESYIWENAEHPLSQEFADDLRAIGSTIPAVKEIRVPWLLIHGAEDDVVPASHSRDLFNHLKGKKKIVIHDDADHDFQGSRQAIAEAIHAWLMKYLR